MNVRRSFVLVVCLAFLGSYPLRAASYGFGVIKKNVTVTRRLVPEVQLSDVSISIGFPRGNNGFDERTFIPILESLLAQGGQNLAVVDKNPEFELRLSVSNFIRPGVEKKQEGKSTNYTKTGSATITFELVHHVDGQIVLSRAESFAVNESALPIPQKSVFGMKMPTLISSANEQTKPESVGAEMNNALAVKIASHLVTLPEEIPLSLAKGPGLDDLNKLADAKRWTEYLEHLSTMTPIAAPADDAYRIYDIGVANEALGYASDDPKVTLKLLREASINYSKAMEANSSERYFTVSQARIESALSRYTTLAERKKQTDRMAEADQQAKKDHEAKKKAGAIDNSDIIKLVRARLDPSIIVTRIRTAKIADFDLSTDGLVDLSAAGVPAPIINEMTIRASGGPTAPPPPSPSPARGGTRR